MRLRTAAHRAAGTKPSVHGGTVTRLLICLLDERGEDLIEYALLGATIAFVGVAAFNALGVAMNSSYASWDTAAQDLWEIPDPQ